MTPLPVHRLRRPRHDADGSVRLLRIAKRPRELRDARIYQGKPQGPAGLGIGLPPLFTRHT